MNKQTKTVLIVVLAIVVVGVGYYGFNRWRQQRLANQILKGVYGVETGGLLGSLTGGGNIQEQIAKEIAKEAAEEAAEEAREAAKTPEDRYDETEETQTYDTNSSAVANDGKDIVEKVFGKAKLTTLSTGMYMGNQADGSGVLAFKISRLTTGADLGALNKVFTERGYQIMQSGIEDNSAALMAGDDTTIYSVSFDIGSQEVGILIMKN